MLKKLMAFFLSLYLKGKRVDLAARKPLKMNLQFFAEGGDGGDGGSGGGGEDSQGGTGSGDEGKGDEGNKGNEKNFTQAELNRILAKQKKELLESIEAEKKKAAMTESERLKAEKEEAEKKAKQSMDAANARMVAAEAKAAAIALGVKPDKVTYLLKLADLSAIEPAEDGSIDVKAVNAAIETVLKDLPELKGSTGTQQGGSDFSGGNGGSEKPKTLGEALRLRYAKQ